MKWKRRRHDGYDEHVNGFTLDFWVFFNIWDWGIERRFALPDILKIGPLRFTLEKKWREDRAAKGRLIWRWPFAKREEIPQK